MNNADESCQQELTDGPTTNMTLCPLFPWFAIATVGASGNQKDGARSHKCLILYNGVTADVSADPGKAPIIEG
jgi:hypothetical protein